jgi:hypothetical protein
MNHVDEEEIQFRGGGGGHRRAGGVAAGLGGGGPEDAAEFAKQQSQPGQPTDAKSIGAIDLPVDAAADSAFAKQPRFHVAALDEPEPLDQPTPHAALAAKNADQPRQLAGSAQQEFLSEPDSHTEPVSEHQSVRTEDSDTDDAEPIGHSAVAQESRDPEAAVVQQAEPAEFALDDVGCSYSESVDRLQRADPDDLQAAGSIDSDSVRVAKCACDALVGSHDRHADAKLGLRTGAFRIQSIGDLEPGAVKQHWQSNR